MKKAVIVLMGVGILVLATGVFAQQPDRAGCKDHPLFAYSERFRPVIPTEAGHLFRAKAASHSDLKPATFWSGSEWVAGMHRNGESL
jgi:hypothetical protein